MKKRLLIVLLCCVWIVGATAQISRQLDVSFEANPGQLYGFDAWRFEEWKAEYNLFRQPGGKESAIAWKSVGYDMSDLVDVRFENASGFRKDSVRFLVTGSDLIPAFSEVSPGRFTVLLPRSKKDYLLSVFYGKNEVAQLQVRVYTEQTEQVKIVPLFPVKLRTDSLEAAVNAVYRQANVRIKAELLPVFTDEELDPAELWDNPGVLYDRYTNRMREIRDVYFDRFPNADKNAFYVFLIPGFKDPTVKGYMVRNKAVAFIKAGNDPAFYKTVARQLARGIGMLGDSWQEKGPLAGTTDNLMDRNGTHLRFRQWEDLRHSSHSYSVFDNYEDVRSNNGFVAYYFWEEDKHGNIKVKGDDVLQAIRRPYKKNYLSYHLNITNPLFKKVLSVSGRSFCTLHFIVAGCLLILMWIIGSKTVRKIRGWFRRSWLWRWIVRGVFAAAAGYLLLLSYRWVNLGYGWFEVNEGKVTELHRVSVRKAIRKIGYNNNYRHRSVDRQCSELLIRKRQRWYKTHCKQVLYFSVRKDESGNWNMLRLHTSSDSLLLPTLDYADRAASHYVVLNYLKADGSCERQRVVNHLGMEITDKLMAQDPPRRILLFVNGYRPTSIGHTFEENFRDIRSRGLEFPDSKNLVYSFDRYDYWTPWQAIDQQFRKRINPTEMYYADGHFSVTTSNHRSLLNFTNTSSIYPKRCSNHKQHTCYRITSVRAGNLGLKSVRTYALHRTRPNKRGFAWRRENGRIAGRNIYQALNEIPNRSANDTLFIVAHSMGYAYALGIIDELRGKIHFGAFYIIAPENASAGSVNAGEWREIWQYGSNFNKGERDAPCLQDGVAPQVAAAGLPEKKRVYIPKRLYWKKGFFDSHFIGYYKWILDIPEGKPGYVTRR